MVGEYRTNASDKIVISDLRAGSYSIQEIETPKGYILDDTAKTVVLKQGVPQLVELFNSKLDAVTKEPLADAVIKVTTADGKFIGEYRTDVTGTCKVQEIKVPKDYVMY